MNYREYLLALLFFLLSTASFGQSDRLEAANAKYKSEAYLEATNLYQALYDEGYQTADMLYNLGTSFYKTGDLGKSILFFERSLKIRPNHSQAQQNLQIVNEQVTVQMNKIPEFFLLRYWNNVAKFMSSKAWGILSFLLLSCCVAAIGYWLLHSELRIKKIAFYSGIALLFMFVLSFLFGFSKSKMERSQESAIVMVEESTLFSGPDERSESIQPLSAGVKVKLTDEIDDWYKVELIDKEVGWIQKSMIETI